jgi:ribose transport system permease protein
MGIVISEGKPSNKGGSAVNRGRWRSVGSALSFRRIGAVYVLLVIIIIFSLWKPHLFATFTNVEVIIDQNAITAIIALSLVAALSTGTFDLSVGSVMALASVTIAWLIVEHGIGVPATLIITIAVTAAAGLVNAVLVTVANIDSFIGTLGTGAVFGAFNLYLSGDRSMSNPELSNSFGRIASAGLGGITVPVFVMLAIALTLWWVMEHTVTGRHLYATGFNEEAARLAGVATRRLKFITLIVSALVAGVAGILLTSQLGSSSPDIGPPYLLGAYAAAFLGATQIRPGRFNPFGTVLAVLVIGTGTTGLTLVAAPVWTQSLFTGLALLLALWLSKFGRLRSKVDRSGRRFSSSGDSASVADLPPAATKEIYEPNES